MRGELSEIGEMIRKRYNYMLADVNSRVLTIGTTAEQALQRAVSALYTGNMALARWVIDNKVETTQACRVLEQRIMVLFATQQPIVARDLRMLWMIADIGIELEQITYHACDIARCAYRLHDLPVLPLDMPPHIGAMVDATASMLNTSMLALQEQDVAIARSLGPADEQVDTFERNLRAYVTERIRDDVDALDAVLPILDVIHALERSADRAVRIGERVIYLVTCDTEELDPDE